MCIQPPKPPKVVQPPEVKAPELQLGNDSPGEDTRRRARRGRNQLRTGLSIGSSASGLAIQE